MLGETHKNIYISDFLFKLFLRTCVNFLSLYNLLLIFPVDTPVTILNNDFKSLSIASYSSSVANFLLDIISDAASSINSKTVSETCYILSLFFIILLYTLS